MHKCHNCPNPCVQLKGKTKNSTIIHGNIAIACAYGDALPSGNLDSIMEELQQLVTDAHSLLSISSNMSQNAFNNIRGTWTRYIFSAISWNEFCISPLVNNSCIVSLPSIKSLKFTDLFDTDASFALKSGLLHHLSNQGMELTMTNPDFVCISDVLPDDMQSYSQPIQDLSLDSQLKLSNAYKSIVGSCSYSSLKFGISLKTSLRSDRRYQVLYEGNILKALIAHLQARFWDADFNTNYYAVVANKISRDDRQVLSAPATHSMIDVHTPAIKAIDGIYEVKTTDEIHICVQDIIDQNFIN